MLKRRTVLVAVVPAVRRRIATVLGGHELFFVDSVAALQAAIAARSWNMLLLGSQFDESRPLASLEEVMAAKPPFPVVCVRGRALWPQLGDATAHAMRLASAALGAEHFVDLLAFPDDEEGNARVRAMLERLLEGA